MMTEGAGRRRPGAAPRGAEPITRSEIKAIVFDMDGVLVDSEPLGFEVLRRLLGRYGVRYTQAENDAFVGVSDREHFRALKSHYRLEAAEEALIQEFTDDLLGMIGSRTIPMPGVPEVLQRLRDGGYRLALASSSAPPVIAATVAALGVTSLFEVRVSGLEVKRGKPAPDIFVATAERLGLPTRRCLVIEDSRNGLVAAKAAGMLCVVVPCPTTLHQDFSEADLRLRALPDLLPLLG